MGYYARSTYSSITIDQKHFRSILRDAGLNPDSPGPGAEQMVYDWLCNAGFTVSSDMHGSIDDIWFEYGKYRSSEVEGVFQILAPYVEAGNYIGFVGEDDEQWAFHFDGHECKECYAYTIYPEIPGECGSALVHVRDARSYLCEVFGDQAGQLDSSIAEEIERLQLHKGCDLVTAARDVLVNRLANSQPSYSMDDTEQLDSLV